MALFIAFQVFCSCPGFCPSQSNYDDFNEFFWSPECLNYSYHVEDASVGANPSQITDSSAAAVLESFCKGGGTAFSSDPKPEIAQLRPKKRYVERRNWLHPIWSFWRIHSFLLLALHVMLVLAFCVGRYGASSFIALSTFSCTHHALCKRYPARPMGKPLDVLLHVGVVVDGTLAEALCGVFVTHVTLSLLRECLTIFLMCGQQLLSSPVSECHTFIRTV